MSDIFVGVFIRHGFWVDSCSELYLSLYVWLGIKRSSFNWGHSLGSEDCVALSFLSLVVESSFTCLKSQRILNCNACQDRSLHQGRVLGGVWLVMILSF